MSRQERIAELNEKEINARRERMELEEAERDAVSRPILRKLVGKCFKFLNSYSCSKPGERWWLYCRILSFDEKNMSYKTVQFQCTTARRVEIEYETVYNYQGKSRRGVESGWQPVSFREYAAERRKTLNFLRELLSK